MDKARIVDATRKMIGPTGNLGSTHRVTKCAARLDVIKYSPTLNNAMVL
jgi:hypothetical protein